MKRILVFLFVIISLYAFSTEEYNDLTLFIREIVESGDIDARVKMEFHIIDSDGDGSSYRDILVGARLMLSGGEDLYIEFLEPEEMSEIAFVYLMREEVIFSIVDGVPWKQYRWSYETGLIENLLGQFFRGLMEQSNFSWEVETHSDRSVYKILPSESRMRMLGLLGGGGYLPNLMHIYLSLKRREGYFPNLEFLKITDRLEKEYLYIEFLDLQMKVDKQLFSDLRKSFYETFQK